MLLWLAGIGAATTLALVLGAGCTDTDARASQIRQIFVRQDRELAAERPELIADKYAQMAVGTYPFLRGSAVLFYTDATRYSGAPALLRLDGTDAVPLFGDAHLENLGAAPGHDETLFEATDFDATVTGPVDWELRRAALGVAALDALRAGRQPAGDPQAIAASVGALLDGYSLGLDDSISGRGGPIARGELGAILGAHLVDADERLASREELAKYTVLVEGQRRVQRTSELVDVSAPWDRGLDEALAIWSTTRRSGPLADDTRRIKDVARRLGAGVSSLALHRFYVLLGRGEGEDDDLLLELKEERDPPAPVEALGRGAALDARAAGSPTPDNAARILAGSARLLSSPAVEPDMGRTMWNGVAFLVRGASRARRNLDVLDLVSDLHSGKRSDADLAALFRDIGRLLARGHARASGAASLIRGAIPPVRDAMIKRAVDDAAQLASDHARFVGLLESHGPLLGAPRLAY